MSRISKDVGGYRGRRTVTDILTFVAIALAAIVVLVLAGVFFAQRYIVYTDEGPKLELPPFLQMFRREEKDPSASASLPDPGDVSVVIDPNGSQSEPDVPRSTGFALELSVDEVLNGTAAANLEQAEAEALILEVKAPSGQLAWYSELFTADWAEVNGPRANNDALKQWNEGEVYTIARVCCFRDDSVPYSLNKQALRKGNYNWRDELGLRWMSPANGDNQDYIAGLCAELGAMGFDEIVLEQWHYPIRGNVDNITKGDRYDPASFVSSVEGFLTRVQAALEPYDTKLSLRFERADLVEGWEISGVTVELLDRFAYRFWTDRDGWAALPASFGFHDVPERLVELVTQAGAEREFFQAVLPEES